MKYILLFCLILSGAFTCFASYPDSLCAAYKMAPAANQRAAINFSIAGKFLFSEAGVAVPCLRATIKEAKEIKIRKNPGYKLQ